VIKEVNKSLENTLGDIRQSISDLGSSVSARFLKLYNEELWEDGIFGPNDEDKFDTMKEYMQ
jgi:hypothetical protein